MSKEEQYPNTYTLLKPVKFGSETVTEIRYKEPTGKHVRKVKIGPNANSLVMGDYMDVFAAVADVPAPVIDLLSPADCVEIIGLVESFFTSGQATG